MLAPTTFFFFLIEPMNLYLTEEITHPKFLASVLWKAAVKR